MKFLAIAAAAVAVMACGQGDKASKYGKLGAEVANDPEVMALAATPEATDSVAYLLGVNYGLMFKGNGFFEDMSEINMKQLQKGIADALKAGDPSNPYGVDEEWVKKFDISPYEMNTILNGFLANRRAYKMAFNEKLGEKFLAENAKKDGVQQTESGLQYKIDVLGNDVRATEKDTVEVHYKGTRIDGTVFDSSYDRGETASFPLNRVIAGWTEGMQLVGEGGKLTLWVPYNLGYGPRQMSEELPPYTTLIFEVELIKVKKAVEKPVEKKK